MITYLANPARLIKVTRRLAPLAAAVAAGALAIGLYHVFVTAPADYQQGQTVRIMYIHVPAAWLSLFIYSSMAVAAFAALVWKHLVAEIYAKAVAPVGACFTLVCLVTGSLWGKPMWGTWWVWDARLTSVLILFFLYLGYIVLADAFDDEQRGLKSGNYLLLAGFVNIPVIKFSVDWWNTLHQPASMLRKGGPSIDPAMMQPLLWMAGGFLALFVFLACLRIETAINIRRRENAG